MSRSQFPAVIARAYLTARFVLALQTAYVAFWVLAVPVVWLGWWDGQVAGLDGRNIVAHIRPYLLPVAGLYLLTLPVVFFLVGRGRKAALWTYLFSVSLHATIWFNLVSNPYYDGRLSTVVLVLEACMIVLLYQLVLWRRLV
jgi:hypothetical protein